MYHEKRKDDSPRSATPCWTECYSETEPEDEGSSSPRNQRSRANAVSVMRKLYETQGGVSVLRSAIRYGGACLYHEAL